MTPTTEPLSTSADVFKALGDPIRWNIVQQMAEVAELPCSTLEETLPISKPTISYHTKILVQAGLISVRKQGRSLFYTLRRDVLQQLVDDIWMLAPEPRPVREGRVDHQAGAGRRRRAGAARAQASATADTADREAVLLTW
ncbi:MAG: putative ArsR family transcriptional regulator [Actinomycetia bacterium]|nr:putative ArsR family transcriptional regulator [Actinomycetes bacterium]